MANSDLYGKIIGKVPTPILEYIKTYIQNNKGLESLEGYQHAQTLLSNPDISYSVAKKIKHFFDSYSSIKGNRQVYELHGGIRMKKYIEHLLEKVRNSVIRGKQVKGLAFDNQFRKTHTKSFDKAQQLGTLTNFSGNKQKNYISESDMKKPKQAAIAFIFNEQNQLLLLQRAKNDDWMPMKWATLGGGVDENEDPIQALIREAKEEANAELDNIEFKFEKEEEGTHVFVYKALCTNSNDLKICDEHEKFKWVDLNDIPKFNTVPDFNTDLKKTLDEK